MTSNVVRTLHNDDAHRCVKIIKRLDGSYGFQEFRREPEDAGGWTFVRENSPTVYATEEQALAGAHITVDWLRDMASSTRD